LDSPLIFHRKPTFYTFKHFSAFIHAGWQRVETATDNSGLRISAFTSPDEKQLTVVIINTSPDIDIALDLTLKDFVFSRGAIYRSSETENCAYIGRYEGQKPLKIKASSVITIAVTKEK